MFKCVSNGNFHMSFSQMDRENAFRYSSQLLLLLPVGRWFPIVPKLTNEDGIDKVTQISLPYINSLFILAGLLGSHGGKITVKRAQWETLALNSKGRLKFITSHNRHFIGNGTYRFTFPIPEFNSKYLTVQIPEDLLYFIADSFMAVKSKQQEDERRSEETRRQKLIAEATKVAQKRPNSMLDILMGCHGPHSLEDLAVHKKMSQLVGEIVDIHAQQQKDITFSYLSNGKDGTLMAISKSSNQNQWIKMSILLIGYQDH